MGENFNRVMGLATQSIYQQAYFDIIQRYRPKQPSFIDLIKGTVGGVAGSVTNGVKDTFHKVGDTIKDIF